MDPGFWGGMSKLKKIEKFGQVTKNTLRKIEKCGQGDQKYIKKIEKKKMVKWPKIHWEKLKKFGQETKHSVWWG